MDPSIQVQYERAMQRALNLLANKFMDVITMHAPLELDAREHAGHYLLDGVLALGAGGYTTRYDPIRRITVIDGPMGHQEISDAAMMLAAIDPFASAWLSAKPKFDYK